MNKLILLFIALAFIACTNSNREEFKKCQTSDDCNENQYCSEVLKICHTACIYQECGEDNGIICENKCSNELPFCSKDNKCSNPCDNLECGSNEGMDCGSCNGNSYCKYNSCVNPCYQMQCGEDQNIECGICSESDTCIENNCLNIKQWNLDSDRIGESVITDKNNNMYLLSRYNGLFLRKFNDSGEEKWKINWNSSLPGSDYGRKISIDLEGNIYITGYTEGNFGENINKGEKDIFLTKVNFDGSIEWTKQWGTRWNNLGLDIAIDSENNIYITGSTDDNLDGNTNQGETDIFLTKFSNNGLKEWTKQWGGEVYDKGSSLTIDSNNNIYVTGIKTKEYGATIRQFPFLSKLNKSGEIIWDKDLRYLSFILYSGKSIITDSNDNIYIIGKKDKEYEESKHDQYLGKFNNKGEEIWTKEFGYSIDKGNDITIDSKDNIYIIGETSNGGEDRGDIFLTKFNKDGSLEYRKKWGSLKTEEAKGITIDNNDNIYITGSTYGNLLNEELYFKENIFLIKFKE